MNMANFIILYFLEIFQEFEDLDEIIARYIQPMASFARDIMHFKYYKEGVSAKKDVIDKYLIDEKKKAPSR